VQAAGRIWWVRWGAEIEIGSGVLRSTLFLGECCTQSEVSALGVVRCTQWLRPRVIGKGFNSSSTVLDILFTSLDEIAKGGGCREQNMDISHNYILICSASTKVASYKKSNSSARRSGMNRIELVKCRGHAVSRRRKKQHCLNHHNHHRHP